MVFFDSQELQIIFLSALPLTELRLSIPIAFAMGMSPLKSYLLACIGNFIPIAPVLLLLEPLSSFIARIPLINNIYFKIINRTRTKGAQVEKYGALGLLLFVAVPLPGTGIYSGAILAFLFGIRFRFAFAALTLGMLLAGLLVTLASAGAKELAGYLYDFELFLLVVLLIIIIYFVKKKRHKK
ncbi:MAG: COG2426 family protein [Bacillota bacterium]